MVKILDCTLRDGGYYTNWDFEQNLVDRYLETMNSSPIEYIEVGYWGNKKNTYLGEYYFLPETTLLKLKERLADKKLAVMINAKEWEGIERGLTLNLKKFEQTIDLVRIAANLKKPEVSLELSKEISKSGIPVFINIMYSHILLKDKGYYNLLAEMDDYCEGFYIVDSYGSLFPHEVKNIIENLKDRFKGKIIGFHPHDNLELAFANSLKAIESNVDILDATMTGMGRGAGNLKTELILSYLGIKKNWEVDFSSVSSIVDIFEKLKEEKKWGTNLPYMLAGASTVPQNIVMDMIQKKRYSTNTIIQTLNKADDTEKNKKDITDISELALCHKELIVIGGGKSVHATSECLKAFLKERSDVAIIHSSTRNLKETTVNENAVYLCLTGDEYNKNEHDTVLNHEEKKLKYFIPDRSSVNVSLPEDTTNVFRVNNHETFPNFPDSPLAICLSSAKSLKAETIYLVGFDGYPNKPNSELSILSYENQKIIDAALEHDLKLIFLTPTDYSGGEHQSIYYYLKHITKN